MSDAAPFLPFALFRAALILNFCLLIEENISRSPCLLAALPSGSWNQGCVFLLLLGEVSTLYTVVVITQLTSSQFNSTNIYEALTMYSAL